MKIKPSKIAIEWSKKENPPMMEPIETDLLIKCIKKCKKHIVEIGTYKGGSASLISVYLPKKIKLTTIDIFKIPIKGSIPPKGKYPTYKQAKKTIEKQGKIKKVNIIKNTSKKVAKDWKKKIDILFIDGDHRYKGIKEDFKNWEPHLIKKGIVLIHDINFKGISKLIKEILKNKNFTKIEKSGNLIAIEKIK